MDRWLLITILLPLFGALVVVLLSPRGPAAVKQSALVTALIVLGTTGMLIWSFPHQEGVFAETTLDWLSAESGPDVRLSVGLDGLSVWLFGLSALLTVTSVLVSWEAIRDRQAAFYALLLVLETGLLGVFAARDIILFYIFFEFTLVPLYFLIGIWGSEERRYAANKFFIYTLAGSMLTFLGLVAIVLWNYHSQGVMTFSMAELADDLARAEPAMPLAWQLWIFLALFAGFAIKVPLFPLHTWLPLAHVQAPTAGSVILAGVLLKVGTYGFARFNIPLLPDATVACLPYLLALSVAGILYGALVALAQRDIKRLIAYSSVSHLGFSMLGLFALNRLGMQGGTLQMISHGLATGGLFACVGMLYERYHTRQIRDVGGLARRTPILAGSFLVFTLASIGLPGLSGFVGEFLLLLGMFQRGWTGAPADASWEFRLLAVLALGGVVLGAWYMLWLVERILFGPPRQPDGAHHSIPVRDLQLHEIAAILPLMAFILWIGIVPRNFLDPMRPTLDQITTRAEQAYREKYVTRAVAASGAQGMITDE